MEQVKQHMKYYLERLVKFYLSDNVGSVILDVFFSHLKNLYKKNKKRIRDNLFLKLLFLAFPSCFHNK